MDLEYIKLIIPFIVSGIGTTLKIYVVTLLLSIPLGIICALGKLTNIWPLKAILGVYTWLFRGTPLLLQLFFVYYGVAALTNGTVAFSPLTAAYIAFIVNYGAYFTEIFRGGIQSIDKGQYEAAKALGMTSGQTMKRIILPQATKVILPPLGNEAITLIKDTALCSTITVMEIMRNAATTVSRDVRVEAYVIAAAIYLLLSFIVVQIFRALEKKYVYYQE